MDAHMVTFDEVLTLLREKVAESPDFVYEKPDGLACYNVWHGQPSCVVGHIAPKIGIDVDWMVDEGIQSSAAPDLIDYALRDNLISFSTDEERARVSAFLEKVQDAQDTGTPWSEALAYGERYIASWDYEEVDDDY